MAAISSMERGKLSSYAFKDRVGGGPYHKLQRWENGKNATRYIPADQVPEVEAALAGYDHFRQLTEEYVQSVVTETRQRIASKKSPASTGHPTGRRRRNPAPDCPISSPSPGR
ncbi:MAG: DUF6788 family protein [Limisphaerales bacterium]